jgi:16S rRNA (guanine527-N7)-methyltransferase
MAERQPIPGLERLVARFGLSSGQASQLGRYGEILATDEHAPTTVRDPVRVRDDHLADALVGLELQLIRDARELADLGAGAGVPGIPLAIALPGLHVSLVEGNGRKCEFMRSAAAELGLTNVDVIHGRAETWAAGIGCMDVVSARALAPLDIVAEYAAPLLRLGGALVAWRGQRDPEDEAAGRRAAEILGLSIEEPLQVEPYARALNRYLHVMAKSSPTPDRFPRRDGVARKRPLGRSQAS